MSNITKKQDINAKTKKQMSSSGLAVVFASQIAEQFSTYDLKK